MRAEPSPASADFAVKAAEATVFPILIAISLSHMLNDSLQSLIPAIYPLVKDAFRLNFAQIGLVTFTFQITASLLQPAVGAITDHRPQPFSLASGMGFTLTGLILLSLAHSYGMLLLAVGLVGLGSSVFHPESSRVAYMAAGGRRGLAQSVFQVGGNFGSSLGPLLAAVIIASHGASHVFWFSPLALAAIVILFWVGRWYRGRVAVTGGKAAHRRPEAAALSSRRVAASVVILLVLIFSKFFYLSGMTSYYTFYLIDKFGLSVQSAQFHLFLFQFAVAAGTVIGGPLGDRIGRKYVIWGSILGVAPFTLLLPYVGLPATTALAFPIGIILSSAFPSILVYAQELLPGNLGLISGLFFGFAFGMGGIGSAVLGLIADRTSIQYVYRLTAFLPLLGLITAFLPDLESRRRTRPRDVVS
ncbi:MAG: MFS transporter [Spirochaetia bacterium]|jgi:FSR family fosmidomycin resistance protein-like MFS transporter